MKITKEQLKEIIKEEMEALKEYTQASGKYGFDPGAAPPEHYGSKLMEHLADIDTRLSALEPTEGLEEEKDWMQKAFSKKKGSLHKDLGVPEDKDISVTKMASALRKGGKTEKKARAAVNANPDKYGSIKDVGVEKKKKTKK